jgi:DNA-directed RNA polymerase specialized sigma24 family protein
VWRRLPRITDFRSRIAEISVRHERQQKRTPRFLLSSNDSLGRPIDPRVLVVAQDIASRAISYAQEFLADPCVSVNILEEAAATVSETIIRKQNAGVPPILDLRAYLYRAFLRKVAAARHTEIQLEETFEDHFRLDEGMSSEAKSEARLLLKQVLRTCDRKTMWIIWERIEGRSWEEISYGAAIPSHAARLRYSRAMREIRKAFETNPRAYAKKLQQAEREQQRKARLINLFESLFALRLFRTVGAKFVFGVRLKISDHSKEEMLADVDSLFS